MLTLQAVMAFTMALPHQSSEPLGCLVAMSLPRSCLAQRAPRTCAQTGAWPCIIHTSPHCGFCGSTGHYPIRPGNRCFFRPFSPTEKHAQVYSLPSRVRMSEGRPILLVFCLFSSLCYALDHLIYLSANREEIWAARRWLHHCSVLETSFLTLS